MKKRILVSLCVFLFAGTLAFAGGQGESSTSGEVPTLTWFHLAPTNREPHEDSLFFQEIEKAVGVNIELTTSPTANSLDKLNTMLASRELYDIMVMTRTLSEQYGPQGAFHDLTTTWEKTPNLKRLFAIERNPWLYSTKSLYFMPGSQVPYLEWGWCYDKGIAAELGIDPPKTLDDWLAAWRKVKAERPDVVPLVSRKGELLPFLQMIYGIGSADGAQYTFRDGELSSPWTDERYREMITFINTLYKEELLWSDFTTGTYADIRSFAANGNAFSILDYLGAPFQLSEGRLAAVDAPVGPYGDTGHRWIGYTSYWGASISGQTKNLDPALAVWDYYYSPAGAELAIFGKEGVTFERKADGSIEFTQKVKSEAEEAGLSVDQWLGKEYNVFIFHIGPSLNMGVREQILRGLALGESQERLRSMYYIGSNLAPIAPPIWSTQEEVSRLSELNANLNTFRDEWITKFIVGQEPLSNWDEYLAGMKRLGIEEVIDIANRGYERYLESVGKSKGFIPPTNIDTTGLAKYVGL